MQCSSVKWIGKKRHVGGKESIQTWNQTLKKKENESIHILHTDCASIWKRRNCRVCICMRSIWVRTDCTVHILFALFCQSVYWCCLFSAIKIQEIKINYINESINLLFAISLYPSFALNFGVCVSHASMWLLNKCMMTVLCFDFVKYLRCITAYLMCVCVHFILIVSWQLWLCGRTIFFMPFYAFKANVPSFVALIKQCWLHVIRTATYFRRISMEIYSARIKISVARSRATQKLLQSRFARDQHEIRNGRLERLRARSLELNKESNAKKERADRNCNFMSWNKMQIMSKRTYSIFFSFW